MEAFTLIDLGGGMLLASLAWIKISRDLARWRAEHDAWVAQRPQLVGIVERLKESSDSEGSTDYTPVIVYTLPNGERYAIDGEPCGFPKPAVGSEIAIAYDAAMPSTARLVSPPSMSSKRSFGGVVGFAVLTFVGTLVTIGVRAVMHALR